ncbi:RsmB/NOP family class I SAM-dependent RNA methyltransferase [Paenibacillus sanguinis]|uniref:RsmB/NOP family class I SAM-dependent RNA methyltransferase n=1 Tax=Paenibacillus sanguinis TaxID=225906 RepID=UPI00037FC183|nr:RsmB/NOP family class I SAM-dependent RNA methyltransferase [Paenibacillus sanguinis]
MIHPPLPEAFKEAVQSMLGPASAKAFLDSYNDSRTYGLRLNTLKVAPESKAARKLTELFDLHEVPWCSDGYYYEEMTRPGRHPYHAAGLYYIQEPSAMSAVELLDPRPGDTVLDLAAAPGGKTTQIAAKLAGQGLLISNEIHPQRAKILAENVERLGIRNTIVTQAAPQALSARFPLAFDRIMLDAPCSGEGMFRKDPEAIAEWSPASVELCAARQWDILQDAVAMLKPGGRLAYSTCTFNRRENEETIARLLAEHSCLRLLAEKRVWPHLEQGEGHYVALLERTRTADEQKAADSHGSAQEGKRTQGRSKGRRPRQIREDGPAGRNTAAAWESFHAWAAEELPAFQSEQTASGTPLLFGEALYLLPASVSLSLSPEHLIGLKLPRAGLHLGDVRKGRFQPAHALAMALSAQEAAPRLWTLDEGSPAVTSFLHGETLEVPPDLRGWHLVAIACGDNSYPLGWGKASGGQLKNHLPKGLRLTGASSWAKL